jgi:hypothetical protein
MSQILPKYSMERYSDTNITSCISKEDWSKIIKAKVRLHDFENLTSSMLNEELKLDFSIIKFVAPLCPSMILTSGNLIEHLRVINSIFDLAPSDFKHA